MISTSHTSPAWTSEFAAGWTVSSARCRISKVQYVLHCPPLIPLHTGFSSRSWLMLKACFILRLTASKLCRILGSTPGSAITEARHSSMTKLIKLCSLMIHSRLSSTHILGTSSMSHRAAVSTSVLH